MFSPGKPSIGKNMAFFMMGSWNMEKSKYIEAGQIVNTHGVRGEVKIFSWLDSPEYLKSFGTLYLRGKPVKVRAARVQKEFVIAALEGIEDVNAAMALKNEIVSIDRADAALPEGAFFFSDLFGARVVSDAGEELGTLTDVLERPGNNVYVVTDGGREFLIPAVPEFIVNTDVENGVVTVHLIEGL